MRTLIIADVHANAAAVEVLPPADLILCAGDVVVYGPRPRHVVEALRAHNVRCVRGDEDDAVAHRSSHLGPPPLAAAAEETRTWTRAVLSAEQLAWLGALPPELDLDVDGKRVALTHAYPGDYGRYLGPTAEELERVARAFPRADVVVLGHSHRRGLWRIGDTSIVMPGSLGQGDRGGRASYAVLEHGAITFHHDAYDVERTVDQIGEMPWSPSTRDVCVETLRCGAVRPRERIRGAAPALRSSAASGGR